MLKLQREQLASHEAKVAQLEESLREHAHKSTPTKGLSLQNYVEKDNYLQFEVRRDSNIFEIVGNKFRVSIPVEAIQNICVCFKFSYAHRATE